MQLLLPVYTKYFTLSIIYLLELMFIKNSLGFALFNLFRRGFCLGGGILSSDWSHYALDRHILSCVNRNKL
jgi:hypothetical protein